MSINCIKCGKPERVAPFLYCADCLPSPEERKRRREEAMEDLFRSVLVSGQLLTKTDVEIADLLLVWSAELPLMSPQSDLIDEVIERLKRAGGGPRPDNEDEQP